MCGIGSSPEDVSVTIIQRVLHAQKYFLGKFTIGSMKSSLFGLLFGFACIVLFITETAIIFL